MAKREEVAKGCLDLARPCVLPYKCVSPLALATWYSVELFLKATTSRALGSISGNERE